MITQRTTWTMEPSPGVVFELLPGCDQYGAVARLKLRREDETSPTVTISLPETDLAGALVLRGVCAVLRGTVSAKEAEGFLYDAYWYAMKTPAFREWVFARTSETYRRMVEPHLDD